MNWQPSKTLTQPEITGGMRMIIGDGITSEAMITLTTGTFLTAMAILLGASNFQIGILAGLPTFTNIFQLISIWLVRRYNNRRVLSILCSLLARLPLVIVGLITLLSPKASINALILFLFLYYSFASVSGPIWNAWMKDLIPTEQLGSYFSKRSTYTQILNAVIGISLALFVDYVKKNYPQFELGTYGGMFTAAGLIGLSGIFFLSRTPEPLSELTQDNIFSLLKRPLMDKNFRRLLAFNSVWIFAFNIATPFFIVFLMKRIGLSISYIISFTIVSQLFSVLTVRIWGRFADRYSNKNIIGICAPLYILCLIGWCFVGIYSHMIANLVLLFFIYAFTGIATSGITLSLTNISLKLSPPKEAIVYLSAKNIITSFFSSLSPLLGGLLADFFSYRSLEINAEWVGPRLNKVVHLLSLHQWNFLFLIGAFLAIISIQLLFAVKETGEVERTVVMRTMRSSIKNTLKDYFIIGQLISIREQLKNRIRRKTLPENEPLH